jgi:arabinogalactan endo-1,4-beta-galactosidase
MQSGNGKMKTTRLALTALFATLLVTPLPCLAQPAIGHSQTPAQADTATTNTAYLAAYFDKTEGLRHGSVLPINESEYQAIGKKYVIGQPVSSARAAPQPTLPTFWTGADLSALTFREGQKFRYSDAQGEADLLKIARRNGWNMIRVRLWVDPKNDPFDAASNLQSVTQLGKRIKAEKLGFMLDVHYSDTWADPSAQRKPHAWEKLGFPALVEQTRVYSRHVIAHLRENGALPDMVQIGNETRNGLLYGSELNGAGPQLGGGFWEKTPNGRDRAVQLLSAGLKGVKQGAAPGKTPRTIVHVPDGQDPQFIADYFRELFASARKQNIDLNFDIIGLSYYPAHPWDKKVGYSGWKLERLQQSMNQLARDYGKPVMIVETAWPRAGNPGNDVAGAPQFAFTPAGQVEFYHALIGAVRAVPKGLGIGVLPWDQDSRNWDSVFDDRGHALPAVLTLGKR